MKAYYIIDGDSITGVFADRLLEFISKQVDDVIKVVCTSKEESQIDFFHNSLYGILGDVEFIGEKASSIKNHADIICGVYCGQIINEIKNPEESIIYIVSRDNLVNIIGTLVMRRGIHVGLLKTNIIDSINNRELLKIINISNEKKVKKDWMLKYSNFDVPDYSKKYKNNDIGLVCIEVGTSEYYDVPKFIPFTQEQSVVTLGRKADISLWPWDVEEGIYDQNVVFEYMCLPDSRWVFRSLKGFRRGKKEVSINGKIISSKSNRCELQAGDCIRVGSFVFEFRTNRREEMLRYENPAILMTAIEEKLKSIVLQVPMSDIPEHIADELRRDQVVSWENAYFRHYRKIIASCWNRKEINEFKKLFESKNAFNIEYVKLNEIRNTVMHPSKGGLTLEQKQYLVDSYIKINE